MNKHYLTRLKWKMFFRYVIILALFIMLGLSIVYLFDNVLNGLIIDFLQLFYRDPFQSFQKFFKIFLPFIVAVFCLMLLYFLCKDLTQIMRILMDGMDDVIHKERNKIKFSKDMQKVEEALMKVVDEYETYQQSAISDENKKKDLIYLLAQDIRMPLAKILMYLEFLDKEKRISQDIKVDYLAYVLEESLRLEDMMNEFFDITRFNLQYAKWDPEVMYVDRMIEQVIDECYYMAEEKQMQIQLHQDSHLPLYADSAKVARAMRDLLNTLIVLGEKKEIIHISLYKNKEAYHLQLKVKSLHYSADQLAHMFHNFYRLEDVHGNGKDHVLGLGIAKQIIDMQNGSIRAESIGDDFAFYVTVPMVDIPPSANSAVREEIV